MGLMQPSELRSKDFQPKIGPSYPHPKAGRDAEDFMDLRTVDFLRVSLSVQLDAVGCTV